MHVSVVVNKAGMTCAYCGAPEETRDHVPPKGIFAGLLRLGFTGNLITVPSCKACNNPESKDDDYFRQVMVTIETIEGVKAPAPILEAIQRSVQHAEREGRRTALHALARASRKIWVLAEGAMHAQMHAQLRTAVDIDWSRVQRTILRISRGIYWHHKGYRVPDDFEIAIYGEGERAHFTQDQQNVWYELAQDTLRGTKRIVHPEAFMYAFNTVEADPRIATLVLVFYRKVIFLCMVSAPDSQLAQLVEHQGRAVGSAESSKPNN